MRCLHQVFLTACVPVTVVFDDISTSVSDIVEWEWHFGDGTIVTATNDQSQTLTYNSIGVYNSFLIITNANGCIDTSYNVPTYVGDSIVLDFSVSPASVCPGDTVSFTDLTSDPLLDSIDAWHYYSENDLQFSCFNNPNPTWVYDNFTGLQDVTLMVGYNGCYSTVTKTDIIEVKGPIAKFHYVLDCDAPFEFNFSDSSLDATSVVWDFGDNNTSTSSNPIHNYAATGNYTVTLIANNSASGCPDDTALMIVHVRNLSASFLTDSLLCQYEDHPVDASNSVDVFENCGMGYTWFFSDSTVRPIMTESALDDINLNQTGFVDVMLVVRDINNCVDTAIQEVKVHGILSDFSVSDDTVCLQQDVVFTSLATSDTTIISWSWDFGDDTPVVDINPTHNFTSGVPAFNPYEVFLTVENSIGCTWVDSMEFFLYDPVSFISTINNNVCVGSDVNFSTSNYTNYNTNLNFNWAFGDGGISMIQNPDYIYNTVGNYTATVVYEDINTGCIDSSNVAINVGDFPTASFSTSADSSLYVCPNENIIMTNTSNTATNFTWNFGNGSTSVIENPGTVFDTNGTYIIQLIANLGSPFNCPDTITQTITVQAPYGGFTTDLNGDTICRLDFVEFTVVDTVGVDTFYWDFGDGTGAGEMSPVSHQYTFVPPSNQTFAKLVMTNSDGSCPFTVDTVISMYEVIADFIRNGNDIDTAICLEPFPFTNTSLGANAFYWDFGDNTTSTSANPANHLYPGAGTYEVTLGVKNNQLLCTDTIIKSIIVFDIPEISIFGDTICEGEIANITSEYDNPTYDYLWTSNPTFSINDVTLSSITDTPLENTNYYLTITDTNGCSISDGTFVSVFQSIDVLDFDTTIVIGDSIFLPIGYDTLFYIYNWTPEFGLSCTDCPNPYVQPLEDIEYKLFIEDKFGCFKDEALYVIKIYPETFITLPTTFTPNNDNVNDVIYVEGWGIKNLLEYKIFNRWGELVFETNDINVGWDGYFKGVLQNNEVYVVQVKALTWKDEERTFEGYINLMR